MNKVLFALLFFSSSVFAEDTIQIFDDEKTPLENIEVSVGDEQIITEPRIVKTVFFNGSKEDLKKKIDSLKAQRDQLNVDIKFYEDIDTKISEELSKLPPRKVDSNKSLIGTVEKGIKP